MAEQLHAPLPIGVRLYIVRHGETDWNRDARYQGQRNVPLNATGRAQAARNGEALKQSFMRLGQDKRKIRFVASPLDRAIETMQLLRHVLELHPDDFSRDDALKELHYGHWEGQLAAELATNDAEGVAAKAKDPFRWRPTGGESYRDLQVRIAHWLTTVREDTVAVTHGGVSRVARGAVLGTPVDEVPFLDVPQDRILLLTRDEMTWI